MVRDLRPGHVYQWLVWILIVLAGWVLVTMVAVELQFPTSATVMAGMVTYWVLEMVTFGPGREREQEEVAESDA